MILPLRIRILGLIKITYKSSFLKFGNMTQHRSRVTRVTPRLLAAFVCMIQSSFYSSTEQATGTHLLNKTKQQQQQQETKKPARIIQIEGDQ